jgi:hypothetical protein
MDSYQLQKHAGDASLNRLWIHSLGIVNRIRTVGTDPTTGRQGESEEPGTGVAVLWGDRHLILTAKHLLEKAEPKDLHFFCYPPGGFEYRAPEDLRQQDVVEPVRLAEHSSELHRCDWEDVAVMTTTPDAVGSHVEFFDIANQSVDPPEGEVVHCLGFPFDHSVLADVRMVGTKEERTVALIPTSFCGEVLPLPAFLMKDFDPAFHYLIPYQAASEGKHPRGFSGAATWWESDQKEIIWRPNFKFAGICTSCYKNGSLEKVVKASAVNRFLTELFGPPTNA